MLNLIFNLILSGELGQPKDLLLIHVPSTFSKSLERIQVKEQTFAINPSIETSNY